jgi:NADH:ubiquinone oxidoreductase subunit 3 (subunit A)
MFDWFRILLLMVLAAGFAGGALVLSRIVGPHNPTPEKSAPYECGMPPVGDARERQSVRFYLIAMIFLLFDIEVAFLYPWAMAAHARLDGIHPGRAVHAGARGRLHLYLEKRRARLES